jgi:hypothetical protein
VRELFEFFKGVISKDDLLQFAKGKLYKDNIINVYFRILEKINVFNQSLFNFNSVMQSSVDQTYTPQPYRIMYFSTNFYKKLQNEDYFTDCINTLKNFFKYDIAVMPFFIDEEDDKRCLIVLVKVANNQVDLFDREREEDSKFL